MDLFYNNVRLVHSAPHRVGPAARKLALAEICQMFTKNVIEPSTTKWAGLIVFAHKKDGSVPSFLD